MTTPRPAAPLNRDRPLDDAAAFALHLDRRFEECNPRLDPLFDQIDQVLTPLRERLGPHTEDGKSVGRLHDLANDAITTAYGIGVEFGAAAETVRRSLLGSCRRTPDTE